MTAPRKLGKVELKAAKLPARPLTEPVDMKAAHERISKRYPRILAKLAE